MPCFPHWLHGLREHPDREFVNYIADGIQHGFQLGFNYSSPLRPALRNMPSAAAHPDVVSKYVGMKFQGAGYLAHFPRERYRTCRSIAWVWFQRDTLWESGV